MFRTGSPVGGMRCALFFVWNEGGGLREITLQTDALPYSEYRLKLKGCWQEHLAMLTQIHGRPAQAGPLAPPENLEGGAMLGSHLWRLGGGGTVLLGTAREGSGYQVVTRITREVIQPARLAGTGATPPPPASFEP